MTSATARSVMPIVATMSLSRASGHETQGERVRVVRVSRRSSRGKRSDVVDSRGSDLSTIDCQLLVGITRTGEVGEEIGPAADSNAIEALLEEPEQFPAGVQSLPEAHSVR